MDTKNFRKVKAGELIDVDAGNGLVVEMFRSDKYSGDREGLTGYRPCQVTKNSSRVWDFDTSGADKMLGQAAELFEFEDREKVELVIAICNRNTVFSVIKLNDFLNGVTATFQGKVTLIGGSSMEQLLDVKIELAQVLKMQYWYSHDEEVILRKRWSKAEEVVAASKEEAARKREEAARERLLYVASIANRPRVEAWDHAGKHYYGVPVHTDDEWKCLPNHKNCIIMKDGQPVEAFIVEKHGAKVKKTREAVVSGTKPEVQTAAKPQLPEAIMKRTVTLKEQTRDILVFRSVDDIRCLQQAGLNSGTWVGRMSADGLEITVHEVTSTSMNAVGVLRKSPAPAAKA